MNKHYTNIIFDLDDTLLDFTSAQDEALNSLFANFDFVSNVAETKGLFKKFNDNLWKKLERQEITRSQLLEQRFNLFLKNSIM